MLRHQTQAHQNQYNTLQIFKAISQQKHHSLEKHSIKIPKQYRDNHMYMMKAVNTEHNDEVFQG
jgi:hypothetical protein